MPNIKSAKKRVLIAEKKNLRNRVIKSSLKTSVKKFETALATGDKENIQVLYRQSVGLIDKAVLKGAMHKNTAGRKKAQLAVHMNKAQAN